MDLRKTEIKKKAFEAIVYLQILTYFNFSAVFFYMNKPLLYYFCFFLVVERGHTLMAQSNKKLFHGTNDKWQR